MLKWNKLRHICLLIKIGRIGSIISLRNKKKLTILKRKIIFKNVILPYAKKLRKR